MLTIKPQVFLKKSYMNSIDANCFFGLFLMSFSFKFCNSEQLLPSFVDTNFPEFLQLKTNKMFLEYTVGMRSYMMLW